MKDPHIRDYQGKRIHMIGIGGSSMSGLAEMLMDQGYRVTGSDRDDGYLLKGLREKGCEIMIGHRAENVHGADLVVYSAAVGLLGGMRPLDFLKGQLPAMIFAFSSASSVGTLPVNMKGCEKMGADPEISSFVLPLGATINMDGTAIYQGVCAIFIAACYGVRLTPGQMVTIVLTATLASIGTAGVPGAGVVMLAMVLQSVGLPVEGIALVAGVDRIFDMGRTVVNITGDASCAIVVSRQERLR